MNFTEFKKVILENIEKKNKNSIYLDKRNINGVNHTLKYMYKIPLCTYATNLNTKCIEIINTDFCAEQVSLPDYLDWLNITSIFHKISEIENEIQELKREFQE